MSQTNNTKAAAGTTLYYSLLYSDNDSQQRTLKTMRLIQTLSTTLFDVSEPQVAEKKIHWWHEEISRLATQNARHPACVAVQDHQHNPTSLEACLKILSAAASERYNPLGTEQDLAEHIIADYRARMALFINAFNVGSQSSEQPSEQTIEFQPKPEAALAATSNQPLNALDTMALGLGYSHRLNSLSNRLHNGYAVFSDELYQRFNITPDSLNTDNSAQPLLNHVIAEASDTLSDAMVLTKKNMRRSPAHLALLIMCHLRQAQMQLWQKKQPNLIRESIALTPVRKFFVAHRCKRRYAKLR